MRRLGALFLVGLSSACAPAAPAKRIQTTLPLGAEQVASAVLGTKEPPPASSATQTTPSSSSAPPASAPQPAPANAPAALARELFPNGVDLHLPRAAWIAETKTLVLAGGWSGDEAQLRRLDIHFVGAERRQVPVCDKTACERVSVLDVERALRDSRFSDEVVALPPLSDADVQPQSGRSLPELKGRIALEHDRVSLIRHGQARVLFEGESKKGHSSRPIAIFVPPSGASVVLVIGNFMGWELTGVWLHVSDVAAP